LAMSSSTIQPAADAEQARADETQVESERTEATQLDPETPVAQVDATEKQEVHAAVDEASRAATQAEQASEAPAPQESADVDMPPAQPKEDEAPADPAQEAGAGAGEVSRAMEAPETSQDAQAMAVDGDAAAPLQEGEEVAAEDGAPESSDPTATAEEAKPADSVADAKASASASSKKKRKAPSLDGMVLQIKHLQAEMDSAAKKLETFKLNKEEIEKQIVAAEATMKAKTAAVQQASQVYVKQQCEAAIAELKEHIPKRPVSPFFMFAAEQKLGGALGDRNKKCSEMWAKLTDQEKKPYTARHREGYERFQTWGSSEEGKKNLRERNELLRKCRAENTEELAAAVAAAGDGTSATTGAETSETPVKKRRSAATQGPDSAEKEKAKPQRTAIAKAASTKEPELDEKVVEEAGKAELLPQLRNLAARPDVLALGKSAQELLDVLKANKGMVNAAKHALLSA